MPSKTFNGTPVPALWNKSADVNNVLRDDNIGAKLFQNKNITIGKKTSSITTIIIYVLLSNAIIIIINNINL